MSSVYKVITPPAVEPITLVAAKAYLRVDFDDDDAVIAKIIVSARQFIEKLTGRALTTQTIQQVDTIERPDGGVLSGPIKTGPNWYVYQEQLGANPFGPAQYYHDLAMPPIQTSQPFTVETKVTAFDAWKPFTLTTNLDGSANFWIDDNSEPARIYLMDPITANFWRFTYVAGYTSGYFVPPALMQCLREAIAYWYDCRDAENLPKALIDKIVVHRVDIV